MLAEVCHITRHGGRVYLSEWVPDLPGIDPLPLEFLLRELDPAQQELAGRALWERRAQDAGFQRGHDLVRPDRLDPIAIGALTYVTLMLTGVIFSMFAFTASPVLDKVFKEQ